MYQFLPDFLFTPRGELSDDEEGKTSFDGVKRKVQRCSLDDEEDEAKRDKKSRPARHTDTNRRRNTESSTNKPRPLAQEYQKPVRPSLSLPHSPSFLLGRYVSSVLRQR